MITLIFLVIFFYVIAKLKDCGSNPEYESWLLQDRAKYPELYEED